MNSQFQPPHSGVRSFCFCSRPYQDGNKIACEWRGLDRSIGRACAMLFVHVDAIA
jgi:hypothetical protein